MKCWLGQGPHGRTALRASPPGRGNFDHIRTEHVATKVGRRRYMCIYVDVDVDVEDNKCSNLPPTYQTSLENCKMETWETEKLENWITGKLGDWEIGNGCVDCSVCCCLCCGCCVVDVLFFGVLLLCCSLCCCFSWWPRPCLQERVG